MTSLYKRNKYSSFSLTNDNSKTEYTNYVPIINNSKFNPLKKLVLIEKLKV